MTEEINIEYHPLRPFLPSPTRLLILGAFPPQQKRWSIHFFYPNFQNDMWRIFGLIFFEDKNHFVDTEQKKFKQTLLEDFLNKTDIGFYDTASAVKRLKNNASDQFLEIVEPTDIRQLLSQIPDCKALATTGKKATETACLQFGIDIIPQNTSVWLPEHGIHFYRMPSSSRAYPLSLEKKAIAYREMFLKEGIII